MARYVLVRFGNDAEAERFVTAVRERTVTFPYIAQPGAEGAYYDYIASGEVYGMFQSPTKFCECTTKSDKSGRSKNYGWWCCLVCRKPKKGNIQHPYNMINPESNKDTQKRIYVGITEPYPKGAV